MNKMMEEVLRKLIQFLTLVYDKISRGVDKDSEYNHLSPTNEAENSTDYIEAIEWALGKSDKIKNIAITGPYGSGKSSIIQTFQKKNELNSKLKFFNISLATFKEDKISLSEQRAEGRSDLLRLIELSILQQIFYRETDATIPDSRFIKIERRNNILITFAAICSFAGLMSYIFLIYPDYFSKFSLIELSVNQVKTAKFVSVILVGFGVYYFIHRAIFLIKNIVIKRATVGNAEIEIDQSISKSILNKHLDEILYFFEMTRYNVVVIEDLDRFEQSEVFTKLRELNLLLNNSKKIKRDIVFIYAIKDDMFKDKDRAKFFDFIIPVIPIINASNSNEILIKIRDKNKYAISNSIIDDLSLFIDDMRLLYNIMNEFHVYSQKIDKKLSRDKLLGMMIYKNMFPDDFASLGRGQGVLYETLSQKTKIVANKKSEIQRMVSQLVEDIKVLDSLKTESLFELRRVYLSAIIQEVIRAYGEPFLSFYLSNSVVTLAAALQDDKFVILKSNLSGCSFQSQNGRRPSIGFNFDKIEKLVDSKFSYDTREKQIVDKKSGEINKKKQEIQKLERMKNELGKRSLKEFLRDEVIKINSDKLMRQGELLNVLLRQGYIDEDYLHYISIFHEGSLSRNDYNFLLSVKTQVGLGFDYKLDNIENLLKKISFYELDRAYTLNYSLLNFLLKSDQFGSHRELLFDQLKNEKTETFKFIDGYIEQAEDSARFVALLVSKWHNFWGYLFARQDITDEKKRDYFCKIILQADIEDIVKVFQGHESIFSVYTDFVALLSDHVKTIQIIEKLNLELKHLDADVPDKVFDHIFDNNYYEINIDNLSFCMMKKGINIDSDFYTKNLTMIYGTSLENLKEYIQDNITQYISQVFLLLEMNVGESRETVLELINNQELSITLKEQIIVKSNTYFDVDDISEYEVVDIAFMNGKISVGWENVCDAYIRNEEELSDGVIKFLSTSKIAEKLKVEKIGKQYPDEEVAHKFILSIIKDGRIEDGSYELLLGGVPFYYNFLGVEGLSSSKVALLVKHKKLGVSKENFQELKEHFPDLRTRLIQKDEAKFIEAISDFVFDIDDGVELTRSDSMSLKTKEAVLNKFSKEQVLSSNSFVESISNLILKEIKVSVDGGLLVEIVMKSSSRVEDKIRMFVKCQSHFTKENTSGFLNSLPEPYPILTLKGKRPKMDKTSINEMLLEALKNLDYISSYRNTLSGKIQVMTNLKD